MLDENLPTFFFKPSPNDFKHHQTFYFTQHGSEPEATYAFHQLDPESPSARNTYASALIDSYNPEIVYGEVLVRPGWTQPTLSQDEIRKNGGLPPPPQPIMPNEFTIQLYNPEQQIVVTQKPGSWGNMPSYEFNMPMHTFRTPSASTLDRGQSDPGAVSTTPKINFIWKREGRLSKDLTCYLTGKSTDPTGKKKGGKEPDITVALFTGLKEVTIYEPNMYRIDMEDPKGLEVVLLLSASVIKDLYFTNMRETFHIHDPTRKSSSGIRGRKGSSPIDPATVFSPSSRHSPTSQKSRPMNLSPPGPPPNIPPRAPSPNDLKRQSLPALMTSPPQPQQSTAGTIVDPLAQWQIEAETARLRKHAEAEERERRRYEEAETRRIKKMLEAEEKERRRKQAAIDKETERLRKKYGNQENLLPQPSPAPRQHRYSMPPPQKQSRQSNVPYLQLPHGGYGGGRSGNHPRSSSLSVPGPAYFGGDGTLRPDNGKKLKGQKKSIFGLKSKSEGSSPNGGKLMKKKSSMF